MAGRLDNIPLFEQKYDLLCACSINLDMAGRLEIQQLAGHMHVVLKLLLQSRHHCIDTTDLIPFLASSTMNNGPRCTMVYR